MNHQSSAELASLEQAAATLNDSNAVSCMVPVFAGNQAVPFPEIRKRKMTGMPGHLGMQTLGSDARLAQVGQSDLVVVCDQGQSVCLYVQDCKSLCMSTSYDLRHPG